MSHHLLEFWHNLCPLLRISLNVNVFLFNKNISQKNCFKILKILYLSVTCSESLLDLLAPSAKSRRTVHHHLQPKDQLQPNTCRTCRRFIFSNTHITKILYSSLPVWPEKNRQMPIKVAQKWFHEKNDRFWHLYQNCLRMWEIWAN